MLISKLHLMQQRYWLHFLLFFVIKNPQNTKKTVKNSCFGQKGYLWIHYFFQTHATAVHELIHALGGTHEQNRPDRDEHVTVHWENIRTGFGPQFIRLQGANDPQKLESCLIGQTNLQNCVDGQTKSRTFGLPYDTNSVMHYRRTA